MNIKLLTKYLAGETTPEEVKEIKVWLSESPANEMKMRELKEIWELSGEEDNKYKIFNANMDWAVLQSRIEDDWLASGARSVPRGSMFGLNTAWSLVARMAAIFLLAGLFGLYTYKAIYVPAPENAAPALKEITMNRGKRGGVTLSDGTKVYLNAQSKIILPSVFSADSREVELEGEAYFDVAKNPNKPFVIRTKGAVVHVLGTSFVVRNYEGDNSVQTVVEEGIVSFRSENKPVNEGIILTKGKLGRLNLKTNEMVTESVQDLALYLGWKEGFLRFEHTAMKEVAKQLERRYDIEVTFDSEKIGDLHLTAELKSRSLQNVIHTISTSLGLKYKIDQHKVSFSY